MLPELSAPDAVKLARMHQRVDEPAAIIKNRRRKYETGARC